MKILLVGSEGAIGKRYQAVISHLGYEVVRKDLDLHPDINDPQIQRILIATPTTTHKDVILEYASLDKPILCEKPMLKGLDYSAIQSIKDLYMVCNYKYVIPEGARITYNYFHGGNEDFASNFAQPLYIDPNANISHTSPIFDLRYVFEGVERSISTEALQQSYVDMIQDFMQGNFSKLWNVEDAKKMSQVLSAYE